MEAMALRHLQGWASSSVPRRRWVAGIMYFSPAEGKERDISWLDRSQLADISDDGKTLLFFETGDGSSRHRSVYIRNVDAPDAVGLGDGWAFGLSPDGKWALKG